MLGSYLKLSLSLVMLLVALMVIIQAQAYDNREARTLLMPEDCPMPCFINIRAGITTADEAVEILKQSGWVDEVRVRANAGTRRMRLEWNWNGRQPAFFDPAATNVIQATAYIIPYRDFDPAKTLGEQARVESISLMTTIPYGDVRLLLGRGTNRPDYVTVKRYLNTQVTAVYSDYGLVAQSQPLSCPVSATEFWTSTMRLVIGYALIEENGRVVCRKAA